LNGAGSGAAVVDAFASLSVVDLKVQDDLTVTDDVSIGGLATIGETLAVTGVLTTTAATVFNGGFAANDGSTITTADNTAQLTLISTDADNSSGPKLTMFRNSGSPADGDALGIIDFTGEDSNGDETRYVAMFARPTDVTNGDEFGKFQIIVATDGVDKDYFHIDAGTKSSGSLVNGEIVFNEDSQDIDFRVESDGNANMLFVDGGNNRVGIGTNAPQVGTLHVHTASAGTVTASTQADDLVVENSAETGITILSPDDQTARIRFSSPSTNTDVGGAVIFYRQNINKMRIGTTVAGGVLGLDSGAGTEAMLIAADAQITTASTITANAAIAASTFAASTSLNISRAQGSAGSPAAMANGQQIGAVNFNGYTSSGGYRTGANIIATVNAGVSGDELPSALKLGTTADGGNDPVTRMTIENNGDVTIEDGNLVIGTSGHGIDFSAGAAAASTSNLLDEYEFGTFTPVYEATGTAFGAIAYASQVGEYIKVGGLVTINLLLKTSSFTAGSTSGNVQIGGLPFAAQGGTGLGAVGSVAAQDSWLNFFPLGGWVNSADDIILVNNTGDRTSYRQIPVANMSTASNANRLYLTATYIAS